MTNIKALLKVFHKHKSYTAINIFGLSVGFALLLVIGLLLKFDLSFDKHWSESSDIFRIDSRFIQENSADQLALSSKFLPEKLYEILPEVEGYARFSRPKKTFVKIGSKLFTEENILYSDLNSLSLFDVDFITGDPKTLLQSPQELIISDVIAQKWFGKTESAMNKIVFLKDKYYTVKGVFKAIPKNSHLAFDGLMSYESIFQRYEDYSLEELNMNIWSPDAYCYIQISNGSKEEVINKMQQFIDENVTPMIAAAGSTEQLAPVLVNLEETHFYTKSDFDQPQGNLSFIKTTAILGIVILLIISINYANLSMSILVQRQKEFGMRRLLGASRVQLIAGIIFESLLSVLFSFMLALVWLFIIDQALSLEIITSRSISYSSLFYADNLAIWTIGLVLIAILSALYPALVFSKANIIQIQESKRSSQVITNLMIGTQFVASFMVISAMLLMQSQLNMVNAFDLGITQAPIISIETGEKTDREKVQLIKSQLIDEPGIESVTDAIVRNDELIGIYHVNALLKQADESLFETVFEASFVGQDYCSVFDIELKSGRDFRQDLPEQNSVLVNEQFAKKYYKGEAVGKPLYFREKLYTIIGTVANFHYQSLREDVQPMAIFPKHVFADDLEAPLSTSFQIRLDQKNQKRALANISEVFAMSYPNVPFSFRFISEKVKAFYQDDEKNTILIGILGFSTILIAIFGLVGLVSFEINQRQKEISIRKILGAKPQTIFLVISKKHFLLLLIACLVSYPATYYFINDWLNDFTYRIDLASSLMLSSLISFFIVISLVLLAMSLKFLEVMRINPVETLRHE